MTRRHWRTMVLGMSTLALFAGAPAIGLAQTQGEPPPPPPPPPPGLIAATKATRAGMAMHFTGGIEIGGAVVTGAPYSADAVTEVVQSLADGNRIVQRHGAFVARDGQGRTRRDMVLAAIGRSLPSQTEMPKMVTIHDPVAGVLYQIDEQSRTASRQPFPQDVLVTTSSDGSGAYTAATTATFVRSARLKEAAKAGVAETNTIVAASPAGAFAMPHVAMEGSGNMQQESLGTQTIEGVEATGTRTTFTIPAGEIGNEEPIKIVSEQWYSAELQTLIMTKRNDPRFGETVYKLTNINRSEPAASLFEVPAGYTIRDEDHFNLKLRSMLPPPPK